ncbi:hypothetical protein D3C81_1050280 [compost metagenome]
MHGLQRGLASVGAVLHRLGVVVHGRDGSKGLVVVAGFLTGCLQHGTQPGKGPLNGPGLLLIRPATCRLQRFDLPGCLSDNG